MENQEQQDWIGAYLELCTLIKASITEIKHIDLWYDQLSFDYEEYPFPEKALFIEFNTDKIDSLGNHVQEMMASIRFIYAFDTYSDTYDGSENQAIALEFGNTIRKLHAVLQGTSGNNFSSLNRTSMKKVIAPEGCCAYAQEYTALIRDYSAMPVAQEQDLQAANITGEIVNGAPPEPPDLALFVVDM